jgi:chromosome segregation ATPase
VDNNVIFQKIQQLKQQGKSNEEIVQTLMKQGIDYQTAIDLVTQYDLQYQQLDYGLDEQLQATAEQIVAERFSQIYYLLQQHFQYQQELYNQISNLAQKVEELEKSIKELKKETKENEEKIRNEVESINSSIKAFESIFEKISNSLMDTTKQLNYVLKRIKELQFRE